MAKAITRRVDVLGFGRGRRKNCVELVRKAAREELDDVWRALAGHRCRDCGDGLLRMAEHVSFRLGPEAGLDVIEKAGVSAGVHLLKTIDYGDAPRTWLAGLTNLLGAIVCAWRSGLTPDVRPFEVAALTDAARRSVPKSSPADVNLRWLRTLALAETSGLTAQTLGMFERVRQSLVQQGRFHDAVRVILDVVWYDAYGLGARSPDRETWVGRADQALLLARRHGSLDLELLSEWREACQSGVVDAHLMVRLMYGVRGLRAFAPTVMLSSRAS